MAIRIGLYDFFAYTIPGVLYLLVAGYAAAVFGFVQMDWATLNGISFGMLILLVGAGYVTGAILDGLADVMEQVLSPSRLEDGGALWSFERRHPQLRANFQPDECEILLRTMKEQNTDVALEIERYNVRSTMLRNISLGMALLALVYVAYFVLRAGSGWNLVLAVICILLSVLAAQRSKTMREWFYLSIYEAAAAHALKDFPWVEQRPNGDAPNAEETRSGVQG